MSDLSQISAKPTAPRNIPSMRDRVEMLTDIAITNDNEVNSIADRALGTRPVEAIGDTDKMATPNGEIAELHAVLDTLEKIIRGSSKSIERLTEI